MATEKPGPRFKYEVDLLGQVTTKVIQETQASSQSRMEERRSILIARAAQLSVALVGLASAGYFGVNAVIESINAMTGSSINGAIDGIKGASDLLMSIASVEVTKRATRRIDNKMISSQVQPEWPEDPKVR